MYSKFRLLLILFSLFHGNHNFPVNCYPTNHIIDEQFLQTLDTISSKLLELQNLVTKERKAIFEALNELAISIRERETCGNVKNCDELNLTIKELTKDLMRLKIKTLEKFDFILDINVSVDVIEPKRRKLFNIQRELWLHFAPFILIFILGVAFFLRITIIRK